MLNHRRFQAKLFGFFNEQWINNISTHTTSTSKSKTFVAQRKHEAGRHLAWDAGHGMRSGVGPQRDDRGTKAGPGGGQVGATTRQHSGTTMAPQRSHKRDHSRTLSDACAVDLSCATSHARHVMHCTSCTARHAQYVVALDTSHTTPHARRNTSCDAKRNHEARFPGGALLRTHNDNLRSSYRFSRKS